MSTIELNSLTTVENWFRTDVIARAFLLKYVRLCEKSALKNLVNSIVEQDKRIHNDVKQHNATFGHFHVNFGRFCAKSNIL
jgi:hypothetical protein